MLNSVFGLVSDVARIVTAPVEIAVDAARVVTQPVAETLQEVVDEVKDSCK